MAPILHLAARKAETAMWVVRVKDRGRDLVTNVVAEADEASALRRVYELLGYAPEKIVIEQREDHDRQAA